MIRNVVDEAVLADELGLDFIGLGEHHRADFAISSPETVLAAIAARTKRIHLGSAVTVLSSDDPIRVFQRFATLDALSNGRAEVILGRGSFTESFPLFGFDLRRYKRTVRGEAGSVRRAAEPEAGDLGRQAASAVERPTGLSSGRERYAKDLDRRRRRSGIGGARRALRSTFDARHHRRRSRSGLRLTSICITAPTRSSAGPPQPIGVHSPGYVADTDEQAREELWPDYKVMRDRIGKERGWPPMGRDEFVQRGRSRLALCRLARNRRAQDRRDREERSASRASS